jgi:hypothetical protein
MAELSLDDVMRAVEAVRLEMRAEIAELKAALAALQARPEAGTGTGTALAGIDPEISPELVAIMAAAITTFLGKKVRVRSARRVAPAASEAASPWAQHGRVFVQAAVHNLRHAR